MKRYQRICIKTSLHRTFQQTATKVQIPRTLQQPNRQDYVCILPPGISNGTIQLRLDNIFELSTRQAKLPKSQAGSPNTSTSAFALGVVDRVRGYEISG